MDNTQKKSFFRRPSDAQPAEAPAAFDRSDWTDDTEPKSEKPRERERERKPFTRVARTENREPRSERSERSDRGDRTETRGDRPANVVRTKGKDFRKEENRRPQEPRHAPENVIFGIHPLVEALEADQPIEKIFLRRATPGDYSKTSENLTQIEELAAAHSVPVQWVPVEKLDRLTRRNNHQGVAATVPPIKYAEISEILERRPTLILVLDGVTDVRNFGAIARSAECAGVDAIVIGAKNCAPINGEAVKSSAGALSRIPVARVGSLRNTLKTIQLSDIKLVAATEKGAQSLFSTDLTSPLAIIMGSEERGISSDTLKLCDATVSIPLRGAIESLNVSAAAAVLLYETLRQRSVAVGSTF